MRIWAFIAASLCSLAQAAWDSQYSGLWFDPAHPGWGISVHQQGRNAVATLLTYRADGQPQWYQADLAFPEPSPYFDDEDDLTLGGELREGGTSRVAGYLFLTFGGATAALVYTIDGARTSSPNIRRFIFAPAGLQGGFTGMLGMSGSRACNANFGVQRVGMTASTDADNTVHMTITGGDTTCSAQGSYQYRGATPSIVGRAQCSGWTGVSDAIFEATDVHIARDSVAMSMNLRAGNNAGDCGYVGALVATRTDAMLKDAQAPHDDVSGLWKSNQGWSVTAHLQQNTLFAAVLAADGSWLVAPDASYETGQDGDFVTYRGQVWTVRGTSTGSETAAAGPLEFTVDAMGYSYAAWGRGGNGYIARVDSPRDGSIAGNYVGVQTRMLSLPPTWISGQISITQDAGAVRIVISYPEVHCDLHGTLQWHGETGQIQGNGACDDSGGGAFHAEDVRLTDQGISMRYWLEGRPFSYGSIAGLRQ